MPVELITDGLTKNQADKCLSARWGITSSQTASLDVLCSSMDRSSRARSASEIFDVVIEATRGSWQKISSTEPPR